MIIDLTNDSLQSRIEMFNRTNNFDIFDPKFFELLNTYLNVNRSTIGTTFYADKENGISQTLGANQFEICNTFILPVKDKNVHSLHQNDKYLEIVCFHQNQWYKIELTPSQLRSNPDWLRNYLGFKANYFGKYQEIVEYINILCSVISTVHVKTYLGWSKSHTGIYITGSGPIGDCNGINVQPHQDLSKYSISPPTLDVYSSVYSVTDLFLNIGDHSYTFPLLSFSLLGCYKSLLEELPQNPELYMYVHGKSGSRKTSSAKVFCNIFDNWEQPPCNFTATAPAIELIMTERRDTVTLIDDVPPASTSLEKRNTSMKVEGIVRTSTDSIGRQKMYSKTRKLDMTPQTLPLITAEEVIVQSVSSRARGYFLPVFSDTIKLDRLTEAQYNRSAYSAAIYYFIEHISKDTAKFVRRVNKLYHRYEKVFLELHPQAHGRQISNTAWLHLSFHVFLRFAQKHHVIGQKQFKDMLQENQKLLNKRLTEMINESEANNETEMFVAATKELIATKTIQIQDIKLENKKKVSFLGKEIKPIGYQDMHYIYLIPDAVFNNICSYFSKRQILFPVTAKTLWGCLQESKLLVPDRNQDGTRTVRLTINGSRLSVIRIDRELFENWGETLYAPDMQNLPGSLARRLQY